MLLQLEFAVILETLTCDFTQPQILPCVPGLMQNYVDYFYK